jgi:hypothetical protein
MLLSLPSAPRNGLRPPRKICGRKNYSKRTTRPIPSRKPSPGRRTTAATAGSPSRPCDRPRLATVTATAPRRRGRLAAHNVDHASGPSYRAALSLLGSAYDHIDLTAAEFGADEPVAPVRHGRFGAIPREELKAIEHCSGPHAHPLNIGARASAYLVLRAVLIERMERENDLVQSVEYFFDVCDLRIFQKPIS